MVAPPDLWAIGVISAVGALLLASANHGTAQSYDTISAALPAWRLGNHHDLDLSQFRGWSDWIIPSGDGWVSNRFPGAILWGAAFYLLLPSPAPTVFPAALAAVAAVVMALVLLRRTLASLVGERVALGAVVVLGLATPVWSVAADALWSHSPALLFLSAAMLALSRGRWGLAGVAIGAAIVCRPHLAVIAVALVSLGLLQRREIAPLRALPGIVIGVGALLIYNWAVFGQPSLLGGYSPEHARLGGVGPGGFINNAAGSLISPSRGLLVYSPVLIVLGFGLSRAWKTAPLWVRQAALSGVAYAVVQLWLIRFTGGNRFYGGRVLLEPLLMAWPLLTLSMADLARSRPWRRTMGAATLASVVLIGVGAVTDHISEDELRPWRDLLMLEALGKVHLAQAGMVAVALVIAGVSVMTFVGRSSSPVPPQSFRGQPGRMSAAPSSPATPSTSRSTTGQRDPSGPRDPRPAAGR